MAAVYQRAEAKRSFTVGGRGIAYHRTRMNAPPQDPPASPCVRNCCLDEQNVCMGCGRSLDEIVAWGTASDADKTAILARSRERSQRRAERFR